MYDLPSQNDIVKVVIDKNVVDAESKPLVIYKSNQITRKSISLDIHKFDHKLGS